MSTEAKTQESPGDTAGEDLRVSVIAKTPSGFRRLQGSVSRANLANLAKTRARRHAEVLSAQGVDGSLPECKPEVDSPEPLFYEGSLDRTSKAKLWGLHPKWGPYFKLFLRILAIVLDVMTFPFAKTKSRILYAKFYRSLAFIFFICVPIFFWGLTTILEGSTTFFRPLVVIIAIGRYAIPGGLFILGWMALFGSIRQQNGRSFMEELRPFYDPIPAYEQGPVISIGHLLLSLKDCHTNIISFGGIGSGKCWAPGTRMLMFDGTVKRVEDIRVGDLLMGPDSKPRRVLSTTRGRAPMYWISERGKNRGSGWGCNDVHMLTLKHAQGRPRPKWRQLSKSKRRETGQALAPYFDGLYQVAGVRSFGTNERTNKPIVPQDLAEVELKGFLERTPAAQRRGYALSSHWKMFRTAVEFHDSAEAATLSVDEFYQLGMETAGISAIWEPEIYLRASRAKRLAFLAGWVDAAGSYRNGSFWLKVEGVWKQHLALITRSVGLKVDECATGLMVRAGGISLSDLPTRVSNHRARVSSRKGSDPLMYDWKVEPTGEGDYFGFTIEGDGRLLLEDCTVTHNTASFVNPTLLQFFRKLNSDDHKSVYAKWGGLVLDVKGDFIDFVIYCFRLTGRPLIDLVIIDPEIDLVRYNPLDSSDKVRFAEAGAAKLAAVQRIIGGGSDSKDKYWNDTSKSVIASILKALQVMKDAKDINLADVGRYARDDDMVNALIKEAKSRLERDRYKLNEEEYNGYNDSVEKLRNEWVNLSENTKSILKTTISGMLGPIVSSTTLQRCFCRETNFDFKQVITEGKVVLFRGSALDRETRRLIAVCLKMDFQTWAQRRNGSSKSRYGLDQDGAKRTILFVCDEYQEYVTTGGEGDEAFYGVSRSCLVCAILATQHVTSLEVTINNENQTKTLINNICTKVFLNSPDEKTGKLGEYLGSQYEREQHSNSVGTGGVFKGKDSGGGNVSVSKQVQQHFRADVFANLLTLDMEKSRKPPWYSEAIVYHYNQWEKGPTKMHRTRLMHCYAPRDYMADLSQSYDVILRDRNAQRIITRAGLALQANASEIREEAAKVFQKHRLLAEQELEEGSLTVGASIEDVPLTPDEQMAEFQRRIESFEAQLQEAFSKQDESKAATLTELLKELRTKKTALLLRSKLKVTNRKIRSSSSLDDLVSVQKSASESQEKIDVADPQTDLAPDLPEIGGETPSMDVPDELDSTGDKTSEFHYHPLSPDPVTSDEVMPSDEGPQQDDDGYGDFTPSISADAVAAAEETARAAEEVADAAMALTNEQCDALQERVRRAKELLLEVSGDYFDDEEDLGAMHPPI